MEMLEELKDILKSKDFLDMYDEETKQIEADGWTRKEIQEIAKFIIKHDNK
jgi:hypothetical protein